MSEHHIDKPIPWSQLTPEQQDEIRAEFEQQVNKAGADLTKGLYRHVPLEFRERAKGKWSMRYVAAEGVDDSGKAPDA